MRVSWGILADMLTLWEQKRHERSQFTTLLVVPLQKFTTLAITQGFCSAFSPIIPLLWLNCMSNLTQYFYSYTSVAYFFPAQHGSVIHVCEAVLQVLANSPILWNDSKMHLMGCVVCLLLSGVMRSWFSFLRTNSVQFLFHKAPEVTHGRAGFIAAQRCLFQSAVVWRVCVCHSCVVCLGEKWFIYTSLVAMIGVSFCFVLLDLFL